jgi:hypothetical protein
MTTAGLIVTIGAALFGAFAVHEFGHLAAGRLAGYRFGFLAVGPLWLTRSGICWRWHPRYWAPMAQALPATSDRFAERIAWYIAGGPIASAIVAVVAFSTSRAAEGDPAVFLRALALGSACVFVASIQPFGTGVGIPSDGRRLWLYVSDRERAIDEAAAMTLYGLRSLGVTAPTDLVTRGSRAAAPALEIDVPGPEPPR